MSLESKDTKGRFKIDSWESVDWREAIKYDAATDSSVAAGSSNIHFLGPSIDMSSDPGEIWELNYTLTFDETDEPGIIVLEIQDSNGAVLERIQKDSAKGFMLEATTIVESEQVAGGIREEIYNEDTATGYSYFFTCNSIRLRKATDTQALVNGYSF